MILKSDGWYKFDQQTKKMYKVAEPIHVVKKKKSLEDGRITLVLDDGHGFTHEAPMKILSSKNIEELTDYGFNITPKNKADLSHALNNQAVNMEVEYLYSTVGLFVNEEILEFRGAKLISTDKDRKGTLNTDSRYQLQSKGSLTKWIHMLQNHVQGSVKLELTVALGVSGIIFRYLVANGIDLINPIIHFSGDSSTGKTTAAQLALSVAGNPNKNQGQYKNWNNTNIAFFAAIKGNYGIPLLFDEISLYRGNNISGLIYQLADGNPRGRADKEGNFKKQEAAATVIFSTGENKIMDHQSSTKNTGVGVRILEFEGNVTKSAKQSEAIKRCITTNYGHVLNIVAKELINNKAKDTIDIFNDYLNKVKEQLSESSNVVDRVSNFYAAILTSAEFFNQSLQQVEDLQLKKDYELLNIKDIQAFLINYELNVSKERDIAENAYGELLDHIMRKQNLIADASINYGRSHETIGYFEEVKPNNTSTKQESEYRVKLLKSAFDDFIRERNFEGTKKVQTALKNKGYIVEYDDDRIAKQENVIKSGVKKRESFYQIVIPEDVLENLKFDTGDNSSSFDDLIEDSSQSNNTTSIFAKKITDEYTEIDDEDIQI